MQFLKLTGSEPQIVVVVVAGSEGKAERNLMCAAAVLLEALKANVVGVVNRKGLDLGTEQQPERTARSDAARQTGGQFAIREVRQQVGIQAEGRAIQILEHHDGLQNDRARIDRKFVARTHDETVEGHAPGFAPLDLAQAGQDQIGESHAEGGIFLVGPVNAERRVEDRIAVHSLHDDVVTRLKERTVHHGILDAFGLKLGSEAPRQSPAVAYLEVTRKVKTHPEPVERADAFTHQTGPETEIVRHRTVVVERIGVGRTGETGPLTPKIAINMMNTAETRRRRIEQHRIDGIVHEYCLIEGTLGL